MRTVIPSLQHSIQRLLSYLFLIVAIAFLAAAPNHGDRKAQHFKIEPNNYLRAPDSLRAGSFEQLTGFQFDHNGILCISDSKNMRSLRFSHDGAFLSSILWEKGMPEAKGRTLFITGTSSQGLLYAIEPVVSKRMYAYNDRGEIEKKSNYDQKEFSIWEYVFVDDHTIAASIKEMNIYPQRKLKTRQSIALINLNDWRRLTVNEAERRDGGDFSSDFTNIVSNTKGEFFFGLASQKEYIVFMNDKRGEPIRTITRNYEPVRMQGTKQDEFVKSLEGRKRVEAKMQMTPATVSDKEPFYHAINWLALDSYDNLWVFTSEGQNDDMLSVDLYDPKGNFKKTVFLENKELGGQRLTHIRIRDNHLYSIVGSKEERDQHIYRYELPKEIWQ